MSIWSELAKPFPEPEIHWRVGARTKDKKKGIPLAYIDARNVMERLDLVVGPQNWQCRYPYIGCCELGIRVDGEWIWKANGAGETQVEKEKGQYSDAFKRAAVLFGVGQYLYQLPNTWEELNDYGNGFKNTPKLPAWATPNGWKRLPQSEKKEFYEQMIACLENMDENGVRELLNEYDTQEEKLQVWAMFNSQQRTAIKRYIDDV